MLFNDKNLVAMFHGDEDIFLEIKADFIRTYQEMVDRIKDAAKENDADELQISAHTLKGVLSTFCAEPIKELAFELETMGREKVTTGALEKTLVLEVQMNQLIKELENFDSSSMK